MLLRDRLYAVLGNEGFDEEARVAITNIVLPIVRATFADVADVDARLEAPAPARAPLSIGGAEGLAAQDDGTGPAL